MSKILFRSTNRKSPLVSFREAILKGQPPDYGLYMPVFIPRIEKEEIEKFKNMSYSEIAFHIIRRFTVEEIEEKKLFEMIEEAYRDIEVPVQKIEENFYLLYLDRGPTASFKDFAARLMARIMKYFAREEKKHLIILVATSGDTGGAVANAFWNVENTSVVVLFPEEEITERQRRQMTTLGNNIIAVAVKGKFDDCQAIVKRAFNDKDLSYLNLTSANSINFGRLLPQSVYYFYAFSRIEADEVIFSVPSGNFGNLMGGVFAREMGLPVKKFIVAVNENDEFPEFLQTGIYKPVEPSKKCSSNAMNVGHPSNLARLIDLYGGWLLDERDEKGEVIKKGVLKEKPDMERLRKDFVSFSITDEEVDETIINFYRKYRIIIEPHGAVGIKAVEKASMDEMTISLETANPAKFPEKIKELLGITPELPPSLKEIESKEEKYDVIEKSYECFKKFLKKKFE